MVVLLAGTLSLNSSINICRATVPTGLSPCRCRNTHPSAKSSEFHRSFHKVFHRVTRNRLPILPSSTLMALRRFKGHLVRRITLNLNLPILRNN